MQITINRPPHLPYAEIRKRFMSGHEAYYADPWGHYLEPFQIFGNLYYVGDKKVCSHLIDTGDGLILFDTGYQHTAHLQIHAIRSLGFDPADIKIIIHSHGHFDHFGAGDAFRHLYGSRIYMSRVDTQLLKEKPERALMKDSPCPYANICWPDVELEDGDTVTLGNTTIRCVLAPGHTLGTMAFFFDVTDGKKTLRAGYLGGAGFLTVYKEFCREYDLPMDLPQRMGDTIKKLWPEQVDIVLGNHPGQNATLEKRAWMLEHPEENPFIDPDGWHAFLDNQEKRRLDFIEKGY